MADQVHYSVLDGAAERRAAWRSSADPATRDAAYAAVLRRQFPKPGTTPAPPPTVDVVDTAPL